MFHHRLESQKYSRGQKSVAIILSPKFTKSYHESGSLPTIVPTDNSKEEYGRFVGLKFSLNIKNIEKGMFRKRKEKNLSNKKIFSSLQFITQMLLMIKKCLTNIYLLFIHKFRKILFFIRLIHERKFRSQNR